MRARHDGLYCMFSASKMVTAMLVHLLDERHQVHLDDPVAHYIPEFGKKGKHRITLRHVLTHRAGIPRIPSEFADPNLLGRPAEILGLLCEQAPVWRPGRRLGYHALTGGYVLGAVIERVKSRADATLHLLGLLSDGNVHAHQDHLHALLRAAERALVLAVRLERHHAVVVPVGHPDRAVGRHGDAFDAFA